MQDKLKHHILVCNNNRPWNVPGGACYHRRGQEVYEKFLELIEEQKLTDKMLISTISCLGLCSQGPIVIVYPENVWYAKVCPDHGVKKIFEEHILGGKIVSDLLLSEHVWPCS